MQFLSIKNIAFKHKTSFIILVLLCSTFLPKSISQCKITSEYLNQEDFSAWSLEIQDFDDSTATLYVQLEILKEWDSNSNVIYETWIKLQGYYILNSISKTDTIINFLRQEFTKENKLKVGTILSNNLTLRKIPNSPIYKINALFNSHIFGKVNDEACLCTVQAVRSKSLLVDDPPPSTLSIGALYIWSQNFKHLVNKKLNIICHKEAKDFGN